MHNLNVSRVVPPVILTCTSREKAAGPLMVNEVGRPHRTIWSPSPQAVACAGSETMKTNGLPGKANKDLLFIYLFIYLFNSWIPIASYKLIMLRICDLINKHLEVGHNLKTVCYETYTQPISLNVSQSSVVHILYQQEAHKFEKNILKTVCAYFQAKRD